MSDALNPEAREVVELAEIEARRTNYKEVSSGHILLALMQVESLACVVLREFEGVLNVDNLSQKLGSLITNIERGPTASEKLLPFTAAAHEIVRRAPVISESLHRSSTEPECLLLAFQLNESKDEPDVATRAIKELGVDPSGIHTRLLEEIRLANLIVKVPKQDDDHPVSDTEVEVPDEKYGEQGVMSLVKKHLSQALVDKKAEEEHALLFALTGDIFKRFSATESLGLRSLYKILLCFILTHLMAYAFSFSKRFSDRLLQSIEGFRQEYTIAQSDNEIRDLLNNIKALLTG